MTQELVDLGAIEQSFGRDIFTALAGVESRYTRNSRYQNADQAADQAVQEYIQAMRQFQDQITPQKLLDPQNSFDGNVDPVFTVLVRAIAPKALTSGVWDKFRREWCPFDLPPKVAELLKERDDDAFVQKFGDVWLDTYSNIKLSALQRLGIESVMAR